MHPKLIFWPHGRKEARPGPSPSQRPAADAVAARVTRLLRDFTRVGDAQLSATDRAQLSQLWQDLIQDGPVPVSLAGLERQRLLSNRLWQDGRQHLLDKALEALAPPQGSAQVPTPTHGGRHAHLIVVLGVPVDLDGHIGAGLKARIDRAVYEAQQDPQATLLVSGAAVSPFARANGWVEAYAMKLGLVAAGVDPSHIMVEPNALSTMHNAAFGWQLVRESHLFEQGRPVDEVTLVAEPYHAVRALRIFAAVLQQEPSPPLLHFAAAQALQPHATRHRPERHMPSLTDAGFLAALDRCIEEKFKISRGW